MIAEVETYYTGSDGFRTPPIGVTLFLVAWTVLTVAILAFFTIRLWRVVRPAR